ncbi:hypothetical protein [Granulicatella balaenopterae]
MILYNQMKKYTEQADSIYTTIANVLTCKKLGIKQSDILDCLPVEYLESAVGHAIVYRNSIYYFLMHYEELLGSEDNRDDWARTTIFTETKIMIEKMSELLDINCALYNALREKATKGDLL